MTKPADFIYLSPPHLTGREQYYVQQAFASNWITTAGAQVDAFEQELAAYLHTSSASALSSGTAALHLGLLALGIGSGDEVLCSTFTFVASANPIRYVGATPVFIDSEPTTWNLCPTALENALKDRQQKGKLPKALLLVHLYGMPARLQEIMEVTHRYGVPIIEDAAEALGSRYRDQLLGTFGAAGAFSFNGNKIITTSGGGALVSANAELVTHARWLAAQAKEPVPYYHHTTQGYNYGLSNICAAIGRGQLEVLEERVQQRRTIYRNYQDLLSGIAEIEWLPEPEGSFSNRWLTCFTIKKSCRITPEEVRLVLLAENIEARPLWQPLHRQPLFQNCHFYGGAVAEDLFSRGLCLPSGSNLTFTDQERIANVIKKAFSA
ncbi:MAG: DegT/DnrJ/EryC1/StrS family aminotransferase [Rufibacter sp.]